jgi:hypothetical protein
MNGGMGVIRWAVVFLAACSTPTPVVSTPPSEPPPPVAPSPDPPETAGYTVHEWGLLDIDSTGHAELAAGPGHPRMVSARKPVLYVHLDEGVPNLSFSLDVHVAGGTLLEHWPLGQLVDAGTLRWSATATRAHCATDTSSAPCATTDRVCEVEELPSYDAASAACLDVGGTNSGMLFYRASLTVDDLPIVVERSADLGLRVTAKGDADDIVGDVLRVSTALSGPWPMGHVVVQRAPVPARGDSVSLPVGTTAVDRGDEEAKLRHAMSELGLGTDEADAFVRAWSPALFGPPISSRRERFSRDLATPPMPQDALLFWLPPAVADRIATLAFEPLPRKVSRALLVRIDLGAVSTASIERRGPELAQR